MQNKSGIRVFEIWLSTPQNRFREPYLSSGINTTPWIQDTALLFENDDANEIVKYGCMHMD